MGNILSGFLIGVWAVCLGAFPPFCWVLMAKVLMKDGYSDRKKYLLLWAVVAFGMLILFGPLAFEWV